MNKLEKDGIYSFKLTSGEELVARVVEHDENLCRIENPITIALSSKGLQMIPSMMSSESQQIVELNTNSVVMTAQARTDIANHWIEATTGIKPVSKQILTG